MSSLGIYIHVPFCGKKCGYCDFYSLAYNKKTAEEFTSAVMRNVRHYSDKARNVDTVYFGGGTPSLLTADQLSGIIFQVSDSFNVDENAEITLEANPCTLTVEKLTQLRLAGINRLSVGIQSLCDEELKRLGRAHSAARAVKAIEDAHSCGFDNISCDLMLGIPHQTTESLEASINGLAALPIQHISAYILKIEEGTPFSCDSITSLLPNEDEAAALYLNTVKLLEKHGFMQYEVSNFAANGFESRHNSRYWKCLDYLGIGPSAHSCFGGKRFACDSDLSAFIASELQPVTVTDETPCGFEEKAMLALRLKKGLDLGNVGNKRADIEKKLPQLINAGYVQTDGRFVSLTPEGFLVSNSIIEYLVF